MRAPAPRSLSSALASLPLLFGIPVAAAAATVVHNDMDGDGRSDIVWQSTTSGAIVFWSGGDRALGRHLRIVGPTDFPMEDMVLRGTGHYFDTVPIAEAIVQDRTSGTLYGLYQEYKRPINVKYPWRVETGKYDSLDWELAASGDFDGDGVSDPLLRNRVDGANRIRWSSSWYEFHPIGTLDDLGWKVAGAGDFDGDGRSDILWRHGGHGGNMIWHGGRAEESSALPRVPDAGWEVAGVGDFDGDGQSDIFWRHATIGRNIIWRSGLADAQQRVTAVRNPDWKVGSVGDFDGDGRADVLWRNPVTGANTIWKSAKSGTRQLVPRISATRWRLLH